jgi:hypothetical protein
MRRFDCSELFHRTARGIPGSCGWIEYRWRIPPSDKGSRNRGGSRAAEQAAPDFFRGATFLAVAMFLAVAGVVYAAAQVI